MKRSAFLLFLLWAGCAPGPETAPFVWYDCAEVPCHRRDCNACGGHGHVLCGPCEGRGWNVCTRCRDGTIPCPDCRDGTEKCRTCEGDGQRKGKKCKTCGGDGKSRCSTCGGDRRASCPACGGDRQVDCLTCGARGRLLCMRAIRITEPMPQGDDVWPPAPRISP